MQKIISSEALNMAAILANLLAACLATSIAEVLTLPADSLKTRMQLWGRDVSLLSAVDRMLAENGVMTFFTGLDVAVLRQATYGTLKYGMYPLIERHVVQLLAESDGSLLVKVISALLAGIFSSAICNPTDLLKTRKQGNAMKNMSIAQGFMHIARTEGVVALWLTGLMPNVLRAGVISTAELVTFDACKPIVAEYVASDVWRISISALLAATCSAILSCPFDTVKSRMMNQLTAPKNKNKKPKYASTADCFRQSVRNGGITDLWSGLVAYFLRLGPNTIATLFLLDRMRLLVFFLFVTHDDSTNEPAVS